MYEFVSNAVFQPQNNILASGRRAYFLESETQLICFAPCFLCWVWGLSEDMDPLV